jgi:hypothetical protein
MATFASWWWEIAGLERQAATFLVFGLITSLIDHASVDYGPYTGRYPAASSDPFGRFFLSTKLEEGERLLCIKPVMAKLG